MPITIRLLHESERELANDFFNGIYKTTRSYSNFQWEFVNGPFGPAIYVVAIDDQFSAKLKIVGIQCAIPIELTDVHGNTVLTAKSEDTLVDPAYRGQQIFEKMYDLLFAECKKAGIQYIWGFTPAKKAFERIGFQIPFQAHQALMVFNPAAAYSYLSKLNPKNKITDKLKIAGLVAFSFFLSLKSRFTSRITFTLSKIDFPSKTQVLKKLSGSSSLFFLKMNENYLSWRIKNNPFGNDYENYQFFNGEELVGDVIVNFKEAGYIEQMIFLEKLSMNEKKQIYFRLIQLMKKRVGFIRALSFDVNKELDEQEKLYRKSGFVVIKRGGYFVWKQLGDMSIKPENLFLSRLFTQGN